MKLPGILLIAAISLLSSCQFMQEERKIATEIINYWGAESGGISTFKSLSSSNSGKNLITLKLINIKTIDERYPKPWVTSISATMLFKKLKPEMLKDYNGIKIEVEKNGTTYSNEYMMDDLKTADELSNVAAGFFEAMEKDDFHKIRSLMDTTYFKDSTAARLENSIKVMEATTGRPKRGTCVGFLFDINKTDNEPMLEMWYQLKFSRGLIPCSIYVMEKSKKIGYVGLNQVK